MNRYFLFLAAIAVVIAGIFLMWPNDADEDKKVQIGFLAIGAGLPLFVAQDEGFFEKHGVKVELIEFRSSNDVAAAAIAGRIDIVGTGATNAMLDANSQTNAGFEIFMANNYVKRENQQSTDFFFVRNDIDASSVGDLENGTIAVFPGSVGQVFAKSVLPKLGLDYDDAEIVPIAPPQWLPSLKTGSIDAVAGAVEPFASMIINDGAATILVDGYYAELMPNVPASGAWFKDGAISTETEEAVFAAFKDAVSFIDSNPTEARGALLNYTTISKDIVHGIRLQDWAFSDQANFRSSANEFASRFYEEGGITELPSDENWIWE